MDIEPARVVGGVDLAAGLEVIGADVQPGDAAQALGELGHHLMRCQGADLGLLLHLQAGVDAARVLLRWLRWAGCASN